jgi:hypothetical protein
MQNKQRDLNLRNETSHLEKALQITDNKLNTVINNANARTQDFIALFQKVTELEQNHTVLKDNVILSALFPYTLYSVWLPLFPFYFATSDLSENRYCLMNLRVIEHIKTKERCE